MNRAYRSKRKQSAKKAVTMKYLWNTLKEIN